jgi:GNAT superfamily N-acetyltransferase
MNATQAAKRIIDEILNSQMYTAFKRFDLEHANFQVYGRVTTVYRQSGAVGEWQEVVMLQSLYIDPAYQRKGLFNALVKECKARWNMPVYVQCVENAEWEESLRRSSDWQHVQGHDWISF